MQVLSAQEDMHSSKPPKTLSVTSFVCFSFGGGKGGGGGSQHNPGILM